MYEYNGRKMRLFLLVILACYVRIARAVVGCSSKTTYLKAERSPKFITSPNYPGNYGIYDKRLSCSWLLTASGEYDDVVIQIQVLNSSMEYSTACVRDSVQVYDGPKDFFRPLISWCGKTWPSQTVTSSHPSVLVTFLTDFRNNDYFGFMLAYWVAKKPIFIVNKQEWTSVNYVLLGISIALLTGGPGWLIGLYIKREVYPRWCGKGDKED